MLQSQFTIMYDDLTQFNEDDACASRHCTVMVSAFKKYWH